MNWERARSDAQIEYREQEIIAATARLYARHRYEEITLAMIGQEAQFTRSNLYRYFQNKEEIFLRLLQSDLTAWRLDLMQTLQTPQRKAADCAQLWVEVLLRHPRMLRLFTLLYPLFEPNASQAALTRFKQAIVGEMDILAGHLLQFWPLPDSKAAFEFLIAQSALANGMFHMLEFNEKQKLAMQSAGLPPDPDYYRALLTNSTRALIQDFF